MIHNTDNFIANLIDAVNRRGEDTIIVMFGDHLPTMGLEDSDMKSGDIFKTKYATWNNFGLPKQDADLTAYQLLAHITGQMGIHEGTMFTYTQTQADSSTYQNGLDNLSTIFSTVRDMLTTARIYIRQRILSWTWKTSM